VRSVWQPLLSGLALLGYLALVPLTDILFTNALPVGLDFAIYRRAGISLGAGLDPYVDLPIGERFVYPPPSLLVFASLTKMPSVAWNLWRGLNWAGYLTSLALMLWLMRCITGQRLSLRRSGLIILLWLAFNPWREAIRVGQVNGLILAGLVVLLVGVVWGQFDGLVALGLSLATTFKVLPLIFALWLTRLRRWRALLWAVGILSLLVVSSLLLWGKTLWIGYLDLSSAIGVGVPGAYNEALSAIGCEVLLRQEIGDCSIPFAVGRLVGLTAVIAAVLWVRRSAGQQIRLAEGGLLTLALLAASPIVWYHHQVFLLPALVALVAGEELGWPRWARRAGYTALALIQSARLIEKMTLRAWGVRLALGTLLAWLLLAVVCVKITRR
jgi:hypothetical protein